MAYIALELYFGDKTEMQWKTKLYLSDGGMKNSTYLLLEF